MTSSVDGTGEVAPQSIASSRELDRDIWAMAWPAIMSLVVVNLVDIVDVALVGRLGRQTVAAWGYATQCVNLVETLIQAVGIACVALVARAIGARDPARARRALAASTLVSETVAVMSFLLALLVPRTILRWLDASPEVIDIAVPYFRLFAGAMVLYAAAFMFESNFRAHKLTRGPMVVAVAVMTVKTLLSVLLVFGALGFPRLGLVGAGIATCCAHGVGLLLYVLLSRRSVGAPEHAPTRGLRSGGLIDRSGFWEVAYDVTIVALPSMGERLIMSMALLTYFKLLSGYGTAAIGAYAIGVRLLSLSWVPGVAFGAAASAFVGQALGAGDSARARHTGVRSLVLASLVMGALGVVFLFLRNPLAVAFAGDARIAECLAPFMLMLAIAQPFMGAHFTLAGVLRGSGDTVTPLVGAAVGNWGFRVPLAALATHLGGGLAWVWAALIADHFSRMMINGLVFLFGGWDKRIGGKLGEVRASASIRETSTLPP
ncbi:MAG TPA: MATE family efflux transporter [Polyangiaceae bacterium]|nr:MATE family efflux transporter [Polyangiaceae bacterium]